MMESIKEILMKRDSMSAADADALIEEAKEVLLLAISLGDFDAAENICAEFFGLEPDYLEELL